MTVKELKEKLDQFPDDMPVATMGDIDWKSKDDPNWVTVRKQTWTHGNYPYNRPDFEFVNIV